MVYSYSVTRGRLMPYTISQLAKLSGVSLRTLRFYDEISLLKPAYHGANKYRYYEHEQLLILQQILFFRELGFALDKIKTILTSDDFNQVKALQTHKNTLSHEVTRLKKLIKTINKTIQHLSEDKKMNDKDMYAGFKKEEMENYLINAMGDTATDIIKESRINSAKLSEEDYGNMQQETQEWCTAFAAAINSKLSPDAKEVQKLVRLYYKRAAKFCKLTKKSLIALTKADINYPESRKYYDKVHPNFAKYFLKAVTIFAEKNLD